MLESFYLSNFCIIINCKREGKKGTSITSVSGLYQDYLIMKFIQYFPTNDYASATTEMCKLKCPIPIQIFLLNFSATSFTIFFSFFFFNPQNTTNNKNFPSMQWKILVQAVGPSSKADHSSRLIRTSTHSVLVSSSWINYSAKESAEWQLAHSHHSYKTNSAVQINIR